MTCKRIVLLLSVLLCLLLSVAFAGETADTSLYRTLRQGDKGADVLLFKRAMYYLGYFQTLNALNDSYSAATAERVAQMQEKNGLDATGIATPELQALVFSGNCVPSGTQPDPTPVPTPAPTPVPMPSLPPFTDSFLSEDAEEEEYIFADAEAGLWIYYSRTIAIEIMRYYDPEDRVIWFECDIRCSPDSPLTSYITDSKKYVHPVKFARQNKAVLAVTDDYFMTRVRVKQRAGVIIREGVVLSTNTKANNSSGFPNLETLAVFGDGSMKTFKSNEYTAQEYLDMGAVNVFAFGPILVADGKLGENMLKADYYHYREPRCAIGMVEPYHYVLLVVKGRTSDSRGVYLPWLADKMLEKGVTEALNLDGGATVALVFMGEMINKKDGDIRHVITQIGFGNSNQVPAN